MEMTFKRPATDRQLTFEEISRETRLPVNEFESLVMKALAQGLVRGAIDQVASNVHMTWVQPECWTDNRSHPWFNVWIAGARMSIP
jgi:26S proteasome regulatory subunit N9